MKNVKSILIVCILLLGSLLGTAGSSVGVIGVPPPDTDPCTTWIIDSATTIESGESITFACSIYIVDGATLTIEGELFLGGGLYVMNGNIMINDGATTEFNRHVRVESGVNVFIDSVFRRSAEFLSGDNTFNGVHFEGDRSNYHNYVFSGDSENKFIDSYSVFTGTGVIGPCMIFEGNSENTITGSTFVFYGIFHAPSVSTLTGTYISNFVVYATDGMDLTVDGVKPNSIGSIRDGVVEDVDIGFQVDTDDGCNFKFWLIATGTSTTSVTNSRISRGDFSNAHNTFTDTTFYNFANFHGSSINEFYDVNFEGGRSRHHYYTFFGDSTNTIVDSYSVFTGTGIIGPCMVFKDNSRNTIENTHFVFYVTFAGESVSDVSDSTLALPVFTETSKVRFLSQSVIAGTYGFQIGNNDVDAVTNGVQPSSSNDLTADDAFISGYATIDGPLRGFTPDSSIYRFYPVLVRMQTDSLELPAEGLTVEFRDGDSVPGTTDESGEAELRLFYNAENAYDSYEIYLEGKLQPQTVSLLTSTPIVLTVNLHDYKHIIADYIENLPDECFEKENPNNKNPNKKNFFRAKFNAVDDLIEDGDFQGAIDQLLVIRKKADGESRPPDFITCQYAIDFILLRIDTLIKYLESLLP